MAAEEDRPSPVRLRRATGRPCQIRRGFQPCLEKQSSWLVLIVARRDVSLTRAVATSEYSVDSLEMLRIIRLAEDSRLEFDLAALRQTHRLQRAEYTILEDSLNSFHDELQLFVE